MLPVESLVRAEVQKPDVVLLIGNGAIMKGWAPLPNALGCPHIQDPNILGSLLASYTYRYRRLKNELLISLHDGECDPLTKVDELKLELHALREYRHQIGTAYNNAHMMGLLCMNDCSPVEELLREGRSVGTITVNWDGVIWTDPRFKNVVQLHGLSANPDSLVLPSELGIDDHIFELAINESLKGGRDDRKLALAKLSGHFRGRDAVRLKEAHDIAVDWMAHAEEIFVWGMALHPYDAELLTVLQASQGPEREIGLKMVTIINPNPSDRNRAGVFLGAPPNRRRDYDPVEKKWAVI